MFLGKVLGRLVASARYKDLHNVKLLIVQPLNHNCQPIREPIVAVDTFQAGEGEVVFLEDGREASYTLDFNYVPVDAAVVGIVDMIDTQDGSYCSCPIHRAE